MRKEAWVGLAGVVALLALFIFLMSGWKARYEAKVKNSVEKVSLTTTELEEREVFADDYATKILNLILDENGAAPFLQQSALDSFRQCQPARFAAIQVEPAPSVDPMIKIRRDDARRARGCLLRISRLLSAGDKRRMCCNDNCNAAENAYNSVRDALYVADALDHFSEFSSNEWIAYSGRARRHLKTLKTLGDEKIDLPSWYTPQVAAPEETGQN